MQFSENLWAKMQKHSEQAQIPKRKPAGDPHATLEKLGQEKQSQETFKKPQKMVLGTHVQFSREPGPNNKSRKDQANMCHSGCAEDLNVIKTKSKTKMQGQKEAQTSCKTREGPICK